jgi:hypothetical protein
MKNIVIYDPLEYCDAMSAQTLPKDENVFVWNKKEFAKCQLALTEIFDQDWSILFNLFMELTSPTAPSKLFIIWREV